MGGRGDLRGNGAGRIGGPDNKDAGPCFRLRMSGVTCHLTGNEKPLKGFMIKSDPVIVKSYILEKSPTQ